MDNAYTIVVVLVIFIPLIVIFALMPFLTRKDIMFGVTIPQSEWKNEYFKKLRKNYVFATVAFGLILLAVSLYSVLYLDELKSMITMQATLWGALLIYAIVFIICWRKTKAYKQESGWSVDAKNIAVADTDADYSKRSLSPWWFMLYVVLIAVTLIIGYRLYQLAPDEIPIKVDMQGNPLIMAPKSMNIVYQLVGVQAILAVLFFFINVTIRRARKVIDPDNPEKTSMQNDAMKYRWSVFLFTTGLLTMLIFAQIIVAMFTKLPPWISLYTPMAITLFILVYAIVLSVKTGQSGNRIKPVAKDELGKAVTRDDDSLWKLGSLYVNPNDPAVFVEKRVGIGWTLNWARWQSWVFIAIILGAVIASLVFSF